MTEDDTNSYTDSGLPESFLGAASTLDTSSKFLNASTEETSSPSSTVAALLARLQSSSALASPISGSSSSFTPSASSVPSLSIDTPTADTNLPESQPQRLTFQDILPKLAALGTNKRFVDELMKMKREQEDVENKLWMERVEIVKKQEGRVRVKRNELVSFCH